MPRNSNANAALRLALPLLFRRRSPLLWILVVAAVGGLYLLERTVSEADPQQDPTTQSVEVGDDSDAEPILKEVRRDVFVSRAGLYYTPGSVHEHRINHLMAHSRDEPDRQGSHGVFDLNEQDPLIALVDEAYRMALAGENAKSEIENDRTVYEVDMGRRIGYVGGQAGNRKGKPAARYLRLIVEKGREGPRFITAYPTDYW